MSKKREATYIKKSTISTYDDNTVVTKTTEEHVSEGSKPSKPVTYVKRDNISKIKMSDMVLVKQEKYSERKYDDGLTVIESRVRDFETDPENPKIISSTTTTIS